MLTLWTVGHSTTDADKFNESLASADIDLLVDVRSLPGSRKFPHFNKETMPNWLKVKYQHLPDLGGRRRGPRSGLNDGWRNDSFRSYADYMLTDSFKSGLEQLLELAQDQRVAYMCSEAVPWRCHRSLISDALVSRDVSVVHLISSKPTQHKLGGWGPTIELVGGELHYV